ncbi:DUF6036 family nucleotidyltransferase [Marinilactibacillus kalidii]|uniref:DUF6036 family nucleotidyltransferase n=1 Tax=Marinilactibacillus kalidii TaxID=2820274 RepID=UPI001ABE39F5|nr:DUF6036 family nucleotidyltransferase [Marinilactibacillus kalidii]
MININKYIKELDKLKKIPEEDSKRLIQAAGIISDYVKRAYDIDLIVVGGLSVEVYTKGGYMTQDIDFIGVNHEKIMHALVDLGFKRVGKDSVHDELKIYVEVPDSVLEGSEERIKKVLVGNQYSLSLIGIDDIIIDRIRALVQWKEKRQEKWIFSLIRDYIKEIDLDYIRGKLLREENDRFNQFLDLLKEENLYALKQFELTKEFDNNNIPYSTIRIAELEIIAIPRIPVGYYGLSLSPILMGYTFEEDADGEETFFALNSKNMSKDELLNWLESIPKEEMINKKILIQLLKSVFE